MFYVMGCFLCCDRTVCTGCNNLAQVLCDAVPGPEDPRDLGGHSVIHLYIPKLVENAKFFKAFRSRGKADVFKYAVTFYRILLSGLGRLKMDSLKFRIATKSRIS